MKTFSNLLALTFLVSTSCFAASIEAVRDGTPVVTHSSGGAVYTTIEYPIHVTNVVSDSGGPDLTQKYVLLSIGQVSTPVNTSPCRVAQIGQSALYQGQIRSVTIAVMAPASNQSADCSSAIDQLVNSSSVKVIFQSAMLADGSGMDVAPLGLTISNQL